MFTYQEATNRYDMEDSYQTGKEFDPASILYYPAAVVTDVFTSIANSFTWGEGADIETDDVLEGMFGEDAGAFYRNNRKLVQASSFVAGVFLPGKIIGTGAKLAKAGWLTNIHNSALAGNKLLASRDAALTALKTAGAASAEYTKAKRGMQLWKLGAGASEAAVAELEILALYNGHAWFDGYGLDDFAQNMVIGAGIGYGLKSLTFNKEFRQAAQKVQSDQIKPIVPLLSRPWFLNNQGVNVGAQAAQLKAQKVALLDAALDPEARVTLEASEIATRKRLREGLLRMMSPDLRAASEGTRSKADPLLDFMSPQNPLESSPLETLGQLIGNDAGALVGIGHRYSGSPIPPIRRFTLNSFITDYGLQNDIGAKVVKAADGRPAIEAASGQHFINAMFGTKPLKPLDAIEEAAGKLGTKLPKIEQTETGVITLAGYDAKNALHVDYLQAKIASMQIDDVVKITGGKDLTPLVKAIDKQRNDTGAVALANHDITTKAMTLDDLDGLGIDLGPARAVVDSWFGNPNIIDHKEARLLVGAADDPNFLLDPNYLISHKGPITYNPLEKSVYLSDAEFFHAYRATEHLSPTQFQYSLESTDLPRLQAVYLKFNKDPALRIRLNNAEVGAAKDVVGAAALKKEIITTKMDQIQQGLIRGLSIEQMAKATNTPIGTAKLFVESGFKYVNDFDNMLTGDIMAYTKLDRASISTYLKPKMLVLDGDLPFRAQQQELANVIKLDSDHLDAMHEAVAGGIAATSGSELITNLYDDVITSPLMKEIQQNIELLAPTEGVTKGFFTSRDFALRDNPLGSAVIKLGADFRNHVQKASDKLLSAQLTPAATRLNKNAAKRTQFYMIKQSLDAITGQEAETLKIVKDQASGTAKIMIRPPTPEAMRKGLNDAVYLKYHGTNTEAVWNIGDEVDSMLDAVTGAQSDLLALLNTNRKLRGMEPIPARGIWIPYESIDDQYTAYLVKTSPFETPDVKLITGRNLKDFEARIARVQEGLDPSQHRIVRSRDQLEDWNEIHSFAKLDTLERASPASTKSGIIAEQIASDGSVLDDMLNAYNEYIWSQSRMFMEHSAPGVFAKLQDLSYAQQTASTSIRPNIFTKVQQKPNLPAMVSRTLLNKSDVPNSPIFSALNNAYSASITMASRGVQSVWSTVSDKFPGGDVPLEQYQKISDDLTRLGAPVPWRNVTDYAAANVQAYKDLSQEHIAKASTVLVTLNLRLWEWSHAIVNTLSAPITMSAEIAANGGNPVFAAKHMHQGLKMVTNPTAEEAKLLARWKARGYTVRNTAEVTELFRDLHVRMPLMDKLEQNKVFNFLTKPSDWSEEMTRSVAFTTGYKLAKTKYPTASLDALEAYALQFTNRSMGNYLSRQRPTLFQGSLGATLGLYQTFSLTMAQNIFRYIESKNLKALLTLGGAQQAMFGLGSLPFYSPINQMIGASSSEPGDDITKGVYEMFGDTSDQSRSLAEFVMYGLPSAAFQIPFQTRAELQPRIPFSAEKGVMNFSPVLLNTAYQATKTVWDTGTKLAQIAAARGGAMDFARAIGEGMAGQYLWRPGARTAELLLGRSIDQTGSTVSTQSEVYEPWAVMARVAGSRPMKEQVLRNLRFHARYYDAIGKENRRDAIKALRTMAVDGSVSGDSTARIMNRYMNNGGTVKGFNQALQQAYMSSGTPFADKLIEDIDVEGPIGEIIRTYSY